MTGPVGVSFHAMRLAATTWGAGTVGHCYYNGPPPAAAVAYGPGCPSGSLAPMDTSVTPEPSVRTYGNVVTHDGAGVFGHGMYYAGAAVIDDVDAVGAVGVQIDLRLPR